MHNRWSGSALLLGRPRVWSRDKVGELAGAPGPDAATASSPCFLIGGAVDLHRDRLPVTV